MEIARTEPPRARAQRWHSRASAMLSAPPETAMPSCGRDSNGPSPAISRANSAASTALSLAAAVAMFFLLQPLFQAVGRAGKFLVELGECNAGVVLLADLPQRHAELQEIVGRLAAVRILLIGLGEGDGRILVSPAYIIGLAQPVLRVARQGIARVLGDEGLQGLLRLVVIGLAQQVEGVFVLGLHRVAGKRIGAGIAGRWNRASGRRWRWRHGGCRLHLALAQRPQRRGRQRGLLQRRVRVIGLAAWLQRRLERRLHSLLAIGSADDCRRLVTAACRRYATLGHAGRRTAGYGT